MSEENNIDKKLAKRFLDSFKLQILSDAHGNYTKSFESYKRLSNVLNSVKEEVLNPQKKNVQQFNVLDLGCGSGHYMFLLSLIPEIKDRIKIHGVDLSSFDIAVAKETVNILGNKISTFDVCDIEKDNLAHKFSNHFDIILNTDVIEHLENPSACLEQIKAMLKPGGLAIITTPNEDNRMLALYRMLVRRKKTRAPEKSNIDYIADAGHAHISVKSMGEWVTAFKKLEFVVEKIKRGSLVFGGPRFNRHPVIFAFILIADAIFDVLPFCKGFSEALTYTIRKPL